MDGRRGRRDPSLPGCSARPKQTMQERQKETKETEVKKGDRVPFVLKFGWDMFVSWIF